MKANARSLPAIFAPSPKIEKMLAPIIVPTAMDMASVRFSFLLLPIDFFGYSTIITASCLADFYQDTPVEKQLSLRSENFLPGHLPPFLSPSFFSYGLPSQAKNA